MQQLQTLLTQENKYLQILLSETARIEAFLQENLYNWEKNALFYIDRGIRRAWTEHSKKLKMHESTQPIMEEPAEVLFAHQKRCFVWQA